MSERNLNFEQGVDRKGTRCLRYDFAVQRGRSADILPLWVADMDFKTSSLHRGGMHCCVRQSMVYMAIDRQMKNIF